MTVDAVGPLGPLIVVTDRRLVAAAGHDLVDVVAAAVDAGARTVLLREKDLDPAVRQDLALELAAALRLVGGTLLVSDATGTHRSMPAGIVGRSCHSVADLRAAQRDGVDYATYSPVWETLSKPGYGPALGLDGLAAGCTAVPDLPVYALGGIEPGRVAGCRDVGAAGVAVMGGIMRAEDPAKVVRLLLEEW